MAEDALIDMARRLHRAATARARRDATRANSRATEAYAMALRAHGASGRELADSVQQMLNGRALSWSAEIDIINACAAAESAPLETCEQALRGLARDEDFRLERFWREVQTCTWIQDMNERGVAVNDALTLWSVYCSCWGARPYKSAMIAAHLECTANAPRNLARRLQRRFALLWRHVHVRDAVPIDEMKTKASSRAICDAFQHPRRP